MKFFGFALLAVAFCFSQVASAQVTPVFSYSAGSGAAGELTAGSVITDLSGAGNNGSVINDENGAPGVGSVFTVEDDPFDVVGNLSFRFDGSKGRIGTDSLGLLSDDLIAAAGGYTIDTYVKIEDNNNAGIRSLLNFAGTDGFNLNDDVIAVIGQNGGSQFFGPDIGDGLWHRLVLQVDTSGDVDGTANGLVGEGSLFVDDLGTAAATGTVNILGNFQDRVISVGGHPRGFDTTEFTGLIYNPSVALGVESVPEPGCAAILAGMIGLVVTRRRRS